MFFLILTWAIAVAELNTEIWIVVDFPLKAVTLRQIEQRLSKLS